MDWHAAREAARRRDTDDPLGALRTHFQLPPDRIYLDGNSLGPLSDTAEASLRRVVEEWRALAVSGWFAAEPPWFGLAETLAARIAPFVGASPAEVAIGNSTTVNLHQALATLYCTESSRTRILVDDLCFPTDGYAVASFLRRIGRNPAEHGVRVPAGPDHLLDEAALLAAMDGSVQMALLPAVVYSTGQLLDLPQLTKGARERGVLLGLDCSHSVGVVPHTLSEWDVDFAVWCHYKYVNGGPGAPAGLFMHRRHLGRAPGVAGWWGSDKSRQLAMEPELASAEGAGRYQIGTPGILGLAALEGALVPLEEAGIGALREKSVALTGYLLELCRELLTPYGFQIVTPPEPGRRGGHVALSHPAAREYCEALARANVVADFRRPDILRLAPSPLYIGYHDCLEAIRRLHVLAVQDGGSCCSGALPGSPTTTGALHPTLH